MGKKCDHQKTTSVIALEEKIDVPYRVNPEYDQAHDPGYSRAGESTIEVAILRASSAQTQATKCKRQFDKARC